MGVGQLNVADALIFARVESVGGVAVVHADAEMTAFLRRGRVHPFRPQRAGRGDGEAHCGRAFHESAAADPALKGLRNELIG
jgi:hypothetical protein